ncbi:MAG: polymer-forming cytoskeletal protein [Bacteroidota bacterium]
MAKLRNGSPSPVGPTNNIIGAGTVIEGSLRSQADIHIGGEIKGDVYVSGRTVVSPEGRIEGTLESASADLSGTVDGDVVVQGRLVLKSTARVNGNISTSKLVVEDGAVFTGRCDMSGVTKAGAAKSEAKKPA